MRTAILAVALAACSGQLDDDPTCDPVGTYQVDIEWGAGDCGLSGRDAETFAVTEDLNVIGRADTISTGSFDELADGRCLLDVSIAEVTSTESGTLELDLTVEFDGQLVGDGTFTVAGQIECTQQLAATGRKL